MCIIFLSLNLDTSKTSCIYSLYCNPHFLCPYCSIWHFLLNLKPSSHYSKARYILVLVICIIFFCLNLGTSKTSCIYYLYCNPHFLSLYCFIWHFLLNLKHFPDCFKAQYIFIKIGLHDISINILNICKHFLKAYTHCELSRKINEKIN